MNSTAASNLLAMEPVSKQSCTKAYIPVFRLPSLRAFLRQRIQVRLGGFMGAVLCFLTASAPSFAAEKAQQSDAVDVIKAQYFGHFDKLPPSRKCTPEDTKGAWKEMAVYESSGIEEVSAQKAKGPRYLAFGEYNTAVWQRSLVQSSGGALIADARNSEIQYISTAAGMLYLYKKSLLQESLLCFVATEATKTYPAGMLLLARPIEKDKSLVITLYAPLGN